MRNLGAYQLDRLLDGLRVSDSMRAFVLSDANNTCRDLLDFIADCTDPAWLHIVVEGLYYRGYISAEINTDIFHLSMAYHNATNDLYEQDLPNEMFDHLWDIAQRRAITGMQDLLLTILED